MCGVFYGASAVTTFSRCTSVSCAGFSSGANPDEPIPDELFAELVAAHELWAPALVDAHVPLAPFRAVP